MVDVTPRKVALFEEALTRICGGLADDDVSAGRRHLVLFSFIYCCFAASLSLLYGCVYPPPPLHSCGCLCRR